MAIRYNTTDVIHESFDSETVIVNLRAGIYFSLNDAGLPLWEQIGKGTTAARLSDLWQKTHGVSDAVAQAVARAFLQELNMEQLIVIDPEDFPPASSEPFPPSMPMPALQKYTDLQDLLMLDPIHEVDERGWPHSKPASDAAASA